MAAQRLEPSGGVAKVDGGSFQGSLRPQGVEGVRLKVQFRVRESEEK